MSNRQLVSTGSPFEREAGYSRAVAVGDMVFVAGTTGYDYLTMSMPQTVEEQAHNALRTIQRALQEVGSDLKDVVRATYYVLDIADADKVFPIFGLYFTEVRPAATLVAVKELLKPEMLIEIEVTAVKSTS